ncbi:MAG: hypothetical protein PSV35_08985, partial [bacterium]|nr:hypothetical protein [bacterium]
MDEENRKNALESVIQAEELQQKQQPIKTVIASYNKAITFFLNITKKSEEDLQGINDCYYEMATIYFNTDDYSNAAQCYQHSIEQQLKVPLTDKIARNLTQLYIDLADACYELVNHQAGDMAMSNAIKAFGLIKEKNVKELAIGDPHSHFKQFHDYYEKQLSTSSYLRSAKFLNHGQLLGEKQLENHLFDQFEYVSLGEMKQMNDSIEHMLQKLSLSVFHPVLIGTAPNDAIYRKTAMQYLEFAKGH